MGKMKMKRPVSQKHLEGVSQAVPISTHSWYLLLPCHLFPLYFLTSELKEASQTPSPSASLFRNQHQVRLATTNFLCLIFFCGEGETMVVVGLGLWFFEADFCVFEADFETEGDFETFKLSQAIFGVLCLLVIMLVRGLLTVIGTPRVHVGCNVCANYLGHTAHCVMAQCSGSGRALCMLVIMFVPGLLTVLGTPRVHVGYNVYATLVKYVLSCYVFIPAQVKVARGGGGGGGAHPDIAKGPAQGEVGGERFHRSQSSALGMTNTNRSVTSKAAPRDLRPPRLQEICASNDLQLPSPSVKALQLPSPVTSNLADNFQTSIC
nr:hypothetical protein Iba_chr05dCG5010 [Ipomoea batatas]